MSIRTSSVFLTDRELSEGWPRKNSLLSYLHHKNQ